MACGDIERLRGEFLTKVRKWQITCERDTQQWKSPIQGITDRVFPCLSEVMKFFKTNKQTMLPSFLADGPDFLYFDGPCIWCQSGRTSTSVRAFEAPKGFRRVLQSTFKQDVCASNCSVIRGNGSWGGEESSSRRGLSSNLKSWPTIWTWTCDFTRRSASTLVKWVQWCPQRGYQELYVRYHYCPYDFGETNDYVLYTT